MAVTEKAQQAINASFDRWGVHVNPDGTYACTAPETPQDPAPPKGVIETVHLPESTMPPVREIGFVAVGAES